MFKIGSPVVGGDFVDRTKHLPTFRLLLESNQHITIKAPRRFGKTSLVKQILEHEGGFAYVYIDIRTATTLNALSNQILDKTYFLAGVEGFISKAKNSIMSLIKTVQKVKIDNIAEITIDMIEKNSDDMEYFMHALDTVNKVAAKKKVNIKFVMDEFQDIIKLSDKEILEFLRATIQHHKNVTYVFLGSIESIMTNIFEVKSSPFFHFTKVIQLGGLDTKEVLDYTKNALERKKIIFEEEGLENIIEYLGGHPDYTAQTLQNLYINAIVEGNMRVTRADCIKALTSTLLDNKAYLEELISKARMKKYQYEVLNAIANDLTAELTSNALYKTNTSLENLGLIRNVSRGEYVLTDIFLNTLLQQNHDELLTIDTLVSQKN